MMRTWCVGRWLASNASSVRAFSALPAQQTAETVSAYRPVKFRASENDTAKQSERDLGMFYRLPDSDVQRLFSVYSQWRPKYVELAKAFCESCLMVRKPALEVIQYLKNFDASRPCVRYVLYGRHGVGKSMSLSHVMHYGATHDWVIVNAHFPSHWFKDDLEMNPSATVEGRFDLPFAGAKFLAHTKAQNAAMFATLTTTREYEWTKRETTPAGAPLSQLIEQGIQRVKFSNDVVLALLSELKAHANAGNCKLLAVIGGVNALFMTSNYATPDRKSTYAVKDFTLAQALYPLLSSDWKGGAVVSSVTIDATRRDNRYSFYPRHLLGEEGFEALDPFVPVRVENYSSKELESCLDYYIDRLWVQNPAAKTPEGRKELAFLSANNPMILQEICGSL